MKPDEILYCECGREARIYGVAPSILQLRHVEEPSPYNHPVILARTPRGGQESRSVPPADAPALPRLPAASRVRAAD